MELIIFLAMFGFSTTTDATLVSSSNFLRYFAIFDDVMYPTTNHTIESPSHVTLQTCAELCHNNSIHHDTKQRISGRSNRKQPPSDMLFRHKQEMVTNSMHTEINMSEQRDTCSAFEYISSIGYCILLKHSAAHDVHGYRSLKQAKGTTYFELSKSFLDLYLKKENAVLDGENTYQNALNSSSLSDCACECMMAADLMCNSFAYSERMRICTISRHVPDVDTTLQPTESYDFYQYSGVWPCNVTLLWSYTPRVIASQRYPYVYHGHVSCYFRLVAPPGQQIILRVKTFFTNQTACGESKAGVFIFDGEDQTTKVSEALCQISDSHRHVTFKSTNGTLFVKISHNHNLLIARMLYSYVQNPSNCASSPCLFNAACVETENSFKCICPPGTSGKRCDKYIGECYRNPCRNGTCYPSGSASGYKCECVKGFTGANCEYNINECFSSPCLHGYCEDLINGYKCACKEPFTGRHCEVNKGLALCSRHVCRFGTCAMNRTGSYCQCFPGFTGLFCETDIDNCENSPCAHGACVDHVNSYQCICSNGYAGKHCDILVGDPCRGNPCYHGFCSVGNEGFSCICEGGYTGSKCESELSVCHSECHHGYCIKLNTSESKCLCDKNFTGRYCETFVPNCTYGVCVGNNILSVNLPNKPESLYSTYKPVINDKTSKLFTEASTNRQTGPTSFMSKFTQPNLSSATYMHVIFSSLIEAVKSETSAKPTFGTANIPTVSTHHKATIVIPSQLSSTTTGVVQSVLPLASDYSTETTPISHYNSEIISTSNGLIKKTSLNPTPTHTTAANDQKGYKTIHTTSLSTPDQNVTAHEFYTINTLSRLQKTSHPNGKVTTGQYAFSTVQPLFHKFNGTWKSLALTTITLPKNKVEISSTIDTPKPGVSLENDNITKSKSVQTERTRSSTISSQGTFTFLSSNISSNLSTTRFQSLMYNDKISVPSTTLHAKTNTAVSLSTALLINSSSRAYLNKTTQKTPTSSFLATTKSNQPVYVIKNTTQAYESTPLQNIFQDLSNKSTKGDTKKSTVSTLNFNGEHQTTVQTTVFPISRANVNHSPAGSISTALKMEQSILSATSTDSSIKSTRYTNITAASKNFLPTTQFDNETFPLKTFPTNGDLTSTELTEQPVTPNRQIQKHNITKAMLIPATYVLTNTKAHPGFSNEHKRTRGFYYGTTLIKAVKPPTDVVTPPPTSIITSVTLPSTSVAPSTNTVRPPTKSLTSPSTPIAPSTSFVTHAKYLFASTRAKTPPTKSVNPPKSADKSHPKTVTSSTRTTNPPASVVTPPTMPVNTHTLLVTPYLKTATTSSKLGEKVNDVITIESIAIGALFVALLIVLAMALFAFYKRARSGTVYISSSVPPVRRDNPSVKKRYSAREIHSDLRSGKLFKPQCVSSELYQRQEDVRKPVYAVPKSRHATHVSSNSSSSTSPASSRSDNYDEVESPALSLPKKIRRLVPVNGPADGKSVVKITRGKGVVTPPTQEYGRPKQNQSSECTDTRSFSEREERESSVLSNENPFYKRDDGTVVLNLSEKHKSRTQGEFMTLLDEILDASDYLTLRRPGMRKSVYYISGTEDGKSEA